VAREGPPGAAPERVRPGPSFPPVGRPAAGSPVRRTRGASGALHESRPRPGWGAATWPRAAASRLRFTTGSQFAIGENAIAALQGARFSLGRVPKCRGPAGFKSARPFAENARRPPWPRARRISVRRRAR